MFAGLTVVAAFGSLGILVTAALFLIALQRIFLGPLRLPGGPGAAPAFGDVQLSVAVAIVPLLAASVVIGVAPQFLLTVIEPAARGVIHLVAR